jgi:Uma2 family endonuclease
MSFSLVNNPAVTQAADQAKTDEIAYDDVTLAADFYPSSDGEPLAETYTHLYAILVTLEVIRQYLKGRRATVLADQYLYYQEGSPNKRVAPDVMVIFDVEPGGRDNYKIWQEGQTPVVIFEMTSESTRQEDQTTKKDLYERIGVQEYWLFDPRQEWLKPALQGYRLHQGCYQPIPNNDYCEPLQLSLKVEENLITFYRADTGERLLTPDEFAESLTQTKAQKAEAEAARAQAEVQKAEAEAARVQAEVQKAEAEAARAQAEAQKAEAEAARAQAQRENERFRERLKALGLDPDE